MSVRVLIEAVESEGFGWRGVVAAAFGDVQVSGVLDGRDDGRADGGQVGGPAAGPAGQGVFAESHRVAGPRHLRSQLRDPGPQAGTDRHHALLMDLAGLMSPQDWPWASLQSARY